MPSGDIRVPARNETGDQFLAAWMPGGAGTSRYQGLVVCDSAGNPVDTVAASPLGTERGLVVRPVAEREPTFFVTTPVSAFAASKFHLVLHNTSATQVMKVQRVVVQPGTATVNSVLSGPWNLRRRESPSTAPSGTGGLTVASNDTADSLPSGMAAYNAPGTSPAGGTTSDFGYHLPQPDEIKNATLDAPTWASILEGGGQVVYDSRLGGHATKAIRIRQNMTLELQQDATSGTGNCRVFAIFTTSAA